MKINVNGVEWSASDNFAISYETVVGLAGEFGNPTVVYSWRGAGDLRRSGEMHAGGAPVDLADGMVFSVMHTGNA